MSKHIYYKKENIYHGIVANDILYIMAEGDYISLFLKNNKKVLLRDSLTQVEKNINSSVFFRSHRSWLVNLEEIKHFDAKGEWLQINEKKIPISRSRRKSFFEKIPMLG